MKSTQSAIALERQKTSLIDLLDWTFRRQRAHLNPESEGFELRLGSPPDSCAKIEHMRGVVGCKIDGGQWKEIGHRVHPDAADVVAAIRALPDISRELVWQYASAGTIPDWGEVCRVWPVRRKNGKIAVNSHEVAFVDRRGFRSIVTASYCPFDVFPNVEYCREEWRIWYEGMDRLLCGLGILRKWEVVGIGAEREPWI